VVMLQQDKGNSLPQEFLPKRLHEMESTGGFRHCIRWAAVFLRVRDLVVSGVASRGLWRLLLTDAVTPEIAAAWKLAWNRVQEQDEPAPTIFCWSALQALSIARTQLRLIAKVCPDFPLDGLDTCECELGWITIAHGESSLSLTTTFGPLTEELSLDQLRGFLWWCELRALTHKLLLRPGHCDARPQERQKRAVRYARRDPRLENVLRQVDARDVRICAACGGQGQVPGKLFWKTPRLPCRQCCCVDCGRFDDQCWCTQGDLFAKE
jgi:hypothetical protein